MQVRSIHSKRSERDTASSRIRATCFIAWQTAYSSVEIIGDWPEPSVLLARVEVWLPWNIEAWLPRNIEAEHVVLVMGGRQGRHLEWTADGLIILAQGHLLCFLQALLTVTHVTWILRNWSGQIIHQIKVPRKIFPVMYTSVCECQTYYFHNLYRKRS